MRDLTEQILPKIETRQPLGGLGPGLLLPVYDGLSIANLPPAILGWLGARDLEGAGLPLDAALQHGWQREFRHVILLVVDGLGLDLLRRGMAEEDRWNGWRELPEDAVLAPLTSIAPSTTSSALTSLWTGLAPGAHGVVGYTQYLMEYGMVANMILHNPATYNGGETGSLRLAGFDPDTFLGCKMLGEHLKQQGVNVFAGQHRSLVRSGLSKMLLPGVETGGLYSLSDLFVTLQERLDYMPGKKAYTYLYWGELDDLAHRYGPNDPRYRRELLDFGAQLGWFLREQKKKRRGDTLFLLTADHGHILTPPDPALEIRRHPEFLRCLSILPCGESRLPYLYPRPGQEQRALDYIEQAWPGRFRALRGEECVRRGFFAPGGMQPHPMLDHRVGDFVLVPETHADYLWFDLQRDNPLRGRHGGLSREEMLVPLVEFVI